MAAEKAQKYWLGLGGNLGDVIANMQAAVFLLNNHKKISVTTISSIYKTPPWGKTDQPWFFNSAIGVSSSLDPEDLLAVCLATELELKRERHERWGPRTIDIDILAMEQGEVVSQRLTVPHPRLTERAFAILPLEELAPELNVSGKSVSEWASIVDGTGIKKAAEDLVIGG